MKFLIKLCISSLAVVVTVWLLPGVHIDNDNFLTAFIVAAVLAFLNAVVKPLMILFTIPVTLFTFGLFLIVINALIILLADAIVDDFRVDGFWSAFFFSIILWMVTTLLESVKRKEQKA